MDLTLALNSLWTLLAAILVFFMQAGFAMVETGFTRAKNANNIIMKNLMDFVIGSIAFFFVGFGLMFGNSAGGFIGTSGFFNPLTLAPSGVDPMVFLIFQTVFAATAATIVSGAMAERTKFVSYLIYSFIISFVIYPIVGHWIWSGDGWLAKLGMIDFAGSTVVHSVGGWSALVGAAILGARKGKFVNGKPRAIPGHNIVIGALGVFILWFGWFGFNPGSTLEVNDRIGHVAVTTNLAACAATLTTLIITWLRYKKPDVSLTLNGSLAGLVAITAGCNAVDPYGALVIGVIAGFVVIFGTEFIERVLKIDDPVGAIAVHGLCGSAGTILTGLFAVEGGLLYGGGFTQLGIQILGVVAVAAWTMITMSGVFFLIKKMVGLRVSEEEESLGLDLGEHGSEAYADFVVK